MSFLFRGKDVNLNYQAHDALPLAAAQAAQLIENLNTRGTSARELTYEFDQEALRWYPSYAILNDGRIVTDDVQLIAIEQFPTGLSLGMSRDKSHKP